MGYIILLFGDRHPKTDDLDDLSVTNNGDTDKVLGTVVAALYAFFDKQPDAMVYATGSTNASTRLYRMRITKFYKEIEKDFNIFGQVVNEVYDFEIGSEYDGFLAQRKFD